MTRSCDSETGLCEIAPADTAGTNTTTGRVSLIYVGDPMCSWCWGVSPTVKEMERYCADRRIGFSLLVGGLRPGGGDPWNDAFRSFLRHEWQQIQERTGQPFGFQLLQRAHYNYDTEPACRAVVAARTLFSARPDATAALVSFFAAVQHKFYTQGADPSEIEFYGEICARHDIDFDLFAATYYKDETLLGARRDYAQARQWGVRGFPSFLLQTQRGANVIRAGYATPQQLKEALEVAAQG